MASDEDPATALRARLRLLYEQVRRPPYRTLQAHADLAGSTLRTSTIGDLLNGPGLPRWATVEAFVRACESYAHAHRVGVPAGEFDRNRWHAYHAAIQERQETRPAGRSVRREVVVPAQLPADVTSFTGRRGQLLTLDGLLAGGAGCARTVVISAIDGTAGVGKTALAVHWAHRVRDMFPDGQLYVNLRGFDPAGRAPSDPAHAIRSFLDALGVPPQRIPVDRDARIGLYRSLVAGKRVLVLLDNARDAGQVRPLLPGGAAAFVLVTSRNRLASLVAAEGARPLTIHLFTSTEARQMLAARIGAERVAAEPVAVADMIVRCARLPLALAIAAAQAAFHPTVPLATLAAQLQDTSKGLGALSDVDPTTDIRAAFSLSYRLLTAATAHLFRLLALHPGPDISVPAAASLAGTTAIRVRPLLAELSNAHLVIEPTPGRYTFHDLLRSYAAEQATTQDTEADRRAATLRILDHYLHTACRAHRLLNPHSNAITPPPPPPETTGATPEAPAGPDDALDWYTAEHPVLLALIDLATAKGFDRHVWQLARSITVFLDRRGHWHDWVAVQHAATAAAERAGDAVQQAHAHTSLGQAHSRLGQHDQAHAHYRQALDLYGNDKNYAARAYTHLTFAWLLHQQEKPHAALEHTQRAYELYVAAAEPSGQANSLNAIGYCLIQTGCPEQALDHCQRALTLLEQLGDQAGQAGTWDSIGNAQHHLGHYEQALNSYNRALRGYRELGDRFFEALTLDHVGDTNDAAGNQAAAYAAWQQANDILETLERTRADKIRAKMYPAGLAPSALADG